MCIRDRDFAIKPMNCPGGILVYQSEPRSYRDLPLRMGELGLVHRHEKSGQLHGLMRVRCFTQDDAHIFMMPEQIREEIKGVAKLIDEVYQLFGFKYHVELSTRPEDSMGSDEDWEMATDALRGALDDLGLNYVAVSYTHLDVYKRQEAGRNVKVEGKDNNLLELIAADPAFNLTLEELQKTMDPKKYVGRAKEQTESFIAKVVNPVLDSHKEMLGMTAEINV